MWGKGKNRRLTKFIRLTIPIQDKTTKLSLNNTSIKTNPEDLEIREDPDDPLCYVKIYEHYVYKLAGPDARGRFFRRSCSQSEKNRRTKVGDTREMGFEPVHVVGKHSFSKYTKAMAKRCGFINPERNTAHGKRKEGISAMSNAEDAVDGKLIMASARHKSEKLSFKYRQPNETAREKKMVALLDKGNLKSDGSSSCSSKVTSDESEESVQFLKCKKKKAKRMKTHRVNNQEFSNYQDYGDFIGDNFVTPSPSLTPHPNSALLHTQNHRLSYDYSFYHPPPPIFSPHVSYQNVPSQSHHFPHPTPYNSNAYYNPAMVATPYNYPISGSNHPLNSMVSNHHFHSMPHRYSDNHYRQSAPRTNRRIKRERENNLDEYADV